jgi:uncharacterized membrane protein
MLGNLLRTGVLASATVVLLGAVLYLSRYGSQEINPHEFPHASAEMAPLDLRSPGAILAKATQGRSRGLIQLGLLMLIATPVARVLFSVFAFARQRDWTYVTITLVVLGALLVSFFSGHLG